MTKTVLITRPNHEVTTNYLFFWSQKIIDRCAKNGHKIIDLCGHRANKKEMEGVIRKTKPALIIINGHGNESTVTGFDNKPLITVGENEGVLASTISFIRACRCAVELGPASIKARAKTFIGYSDDFVFPVDEKCISKPLADSDAGVFLEASNQVAISLFKGHTASDSNERSIAYFKKAINKLSDSDATKEQAALVSYLLWDYQHQVCLGDPKAII